MGRTVSPALRRGCRRVFPGWRYLIESCTEKMQTNQSAKSPTKAAVEANDGSGNRQERLSSTKLRTPSSPGAVARRRMPPLSRTMDRGRRPRVDHTVTRLASARGC